MVFERASDIVPGDRPHPRGLIQSDAAVFLPGQRQRERRPPRDPHRPRRAMLGQMVLYRLPRGPRNVQQEIDRGVGVD